MSIVSKGLGPLGLVLSLAACTPEVPPPAQSKPAEETAPAHDATPPHGGILVESALGHLELVLTDERLLLYAYDDALAPRTPAAGSATLWTSPGAPGLRLERRGDHYEGPGLGSGARPSRVVVTLPGAPPESGHFPLTRPELAAPSGLGLPHVRPEGERVTGGLIDAKCLAEGEEPGPEHAECALSCIKNGSPIALVEEGTRQAYVLVPGGAGAELRDLLVAHLGQRIEAYGKKTKRAGTHFLEVNAVIAEHDHTSLHGGQVAMAGALHLEVLLDAAGRLQIYLSDAFRKPLDARRYRGSAEVEGGAAGPIPLVPSKDGERLTADLGGRPSGPQQVTVRLPLADDPDYFIGFLLDPPGPEGAEPRAERPSAQPRTEERTSAVDGPVIEVAGEYSPKVVHVRRGERTRLRFLRKSSGGCAEELLIPGLEVKAVLKPLTETVVEIQPTAPGEYEFSCGMGMLRGTLVVE